MVTFTQYRRLRGAGLRSPIANTGRAQLGPTVALIVLPQSFPGASRPLDDIGEQKGHRPRGLLGHDVSVAHSGLGARQVGLWEAART